MPNIRRNVEKMLPHIVPTLAETEIAFTGRSCQTTCRQIRNPNMQMSRIGWKTSTLRLQNGPDRVGSAGRAAHHVYGRPTHQQGNSKGINQLINGCYQKSPVLLMHT